MENIFDTILQLAQTYGWIEIKPQKNIYMVSFKKEEDPQNRINIYFTRMTVQIQPLNGRYDKGEIFKNVSIERLEDIFINYR